MNYFQPYPLAADKSIVTAWDSEVARAAQTPWLAEVLAGAGSELFPRFADCYAQLRALPRGARRALQRQLARSQELAAVLREWLHGQAGHALQQKLARSLAGTALLLALGQGVAQANTINVTPKTPPGITLGDGKCSLSEAILSANNDIAYDACSSGLGADTIVLPKGTQSLTYAFPNFLGIGPTGLPVITSDITIDGNRAKITRGKSAPEMRLMAVALGGTMTLDDVTMSGGSSATSGGAIYNKGSFLRINRTTITGNKASIFGGGIFSYQGNVNINNSTISKNAADGLGGGLSNFDGYIRVDNSTISKNSSGGLGGGVLNLEGAIRVGNNSTISKNSARAGGGLWNRYGDIDVVNSIITGNKASVSGGGVFDDYNGTYGPFVDDPSNTFSKNKAPNGPDILSF